ncbi:hypothetical protein H0H92_015414 [Tricholoma furcatifolium]|nr:hypothetical protein H0H92_015414 [Tricholoma furcatifolium]
MDTTTSLSNLEKPALTSDEELLASLGYKQEFQRTFTPFEVFGMSFSIMGLLPAIASVLFYAIPNGGGPAMVWGLLYTTDTNTICNVTAVASVDWGCAVQVMAAIRIGSLGSSEEYEATTPQV